MQAEADRKGKIREPGVMGRQKIASFPASPLILIINFPRCNKQVTGYEGGATFHFAV